MTEPAQPDNTNQTDARATDQRGQTVHGSQTNIAGNVTGPVLSGTFHAAVHVGDVYQLVQGLGDLPTHYDAPVRNFLEYYLGTPERPAPFGGRAADLAALDQWLDDANAPRYLLLAAPAGRGKSALLAHWITQLQSRTDIGIIFFPISARFNSNREAVVFPALYARIAYLHGDKATRAADAHEYRNVFMDYMRRPFPDGRQMLIVLDGLDEAAGWEARADLFPAEPPPHLRVVVTARVLAGDPTWLTRLGWDAPGKAKTLSLVGLNREGVQDALTQMGNPLGKLATKIDVVAKLHELSEGDPLLVRLYVESLQADGTDTVTFKPEDLLTLKPGLKPYFDLWFKQQESLWQSTDKQIDHDAVDDLLNVCATALGPLAKDDILALAPERLKNSRTIERAVSAINRFVIGDGTEKSGYVFSHPRLREYFAERLTHKERAEWQEHFLRYGKETLRALEAKTLKPGEAPTYAVKYYGAHLTNANSPATEFYALMCEGWLRAWEWVDGSSDGFLNDAHRAWARAEAEGPEALGQIARAALCFSSVASVSANIPNDILIACLKVGIINPRLALVIARAKPEAQNRAECLVKVKDFLLPEEGQSVLAEALRATRAIDTEYRRAEALCAITKQLPLEATDLLTEALNIARTINEEDLQGEVLCAIAERLPSDEQVYVLAEALHAACDIIDESSCARALRTVAERLPPKATDLWAEALRAACDLSDESSRTNALCAVVKRLPSEAIGLLTEALRVACDIDKMYHRVEAFRAVAERLPPEATDLLAEALHAACDIDKKYHRVEAFRAVAERLPPEATDLLAEALHAARAMNNESHRAEALCAVAERLPTNDQARVLAEALQVARAISDKFSQASALYVVAERLPPDERAVVLAEALHAACDLSNESSQVMALRDIAKRVPPGAIDLLAETLRAACAIGDEFSRARALCAIAKRLPPEATGLLAEALHAACDLSDESSQVMVLRDIAERVPPEAIDLLAESLRAACAISDESRARALCAIAERLPPEATGLLAEALRAACDIHEEYHRAEALCAVIERLPSEATELLAEALRAARAMNKEFRRAEALCAIIERLPLEATSLLTEALRAACNIENEYTRAPVLSAVDEKFLLEAGWGVLAEAISNARVISDDYHRVETLLIVAEHLPLEAANLLAEALSAAQAISDKFSRAIALRDIAAQQPPETGRGMLTEALSAARAIGDEFSRAIALNAVAERLPPNEQAGVFAEALYAARAIDDDVIRATALSEIAIRLPMGSIPIKVRMLIRNVLRAVTQRPLLEDRRDVLAEALNVAYSIRDERKRANALNAVAERLPPEATDLLAEALRAARTISRKTGRASVLCAVAKRLPPETGQRVLVEALNAARTISDEYDRASVLLAVAEQLPLEEGRNVLSTAIKTARKINDRRLRASALCRIAERLPPEEATEILSETLLLARQSESADILIYVAPRWSAICHAHQISEFGEISATLRAFASGKRENILTTIGALLPIIHRLGGERAVRETAQAIIDTAKWWP